MGAVLELSVCLEARQEGPVCLAIGIRDHWGKMVAAGAESEHLGRWSTQMAARGGNRFRCFVPAAFAPGNSYDLILEVSGDGIPLCVDLPFTVRERDLTLVDEGGRDHPVPALSIRWHRDGDEMAGDVALVTGS
jgi:hypothetical protein